MTKPIFDSINSTNKLGSVHEYSHEPPSPFNLGTDLSFKEACWTFFCLVASTIFIEGVVHSLFHLCAEKEHWLAIINKVYKELMILGVISFTFNCAQHEPPLNQKSEIWLTAFEFSHNLLFLLGLAFALFSIIICGMIILKSKTWGNYHNIPLQQLSMHLQKIKVCGPLLRFFYALTPTGNAVDFLLLRHVFVTRHRLPFSFDFKGYVQETMLSDIDHILDVEILSWVLLLSATALCYVLSIQYEAAPFSGPATVEAVCVFIYIGVSITALEIIVYLVIRNAVRLAVEKEALEGNIHIDRAISKLQAVKCLGTTLKHFEVEELSFENDLPTPSRAAGTEMRKLVMLHNNTLKQTSHSILHPPKRPNSHSSHEGKKLKLPRLVLPMSSGGKIVPTISDSNLSMDQRCSISESSTQPEFQELNLDYAYPFKSPKLFQRFVGVFLLFKCVYVGLFCNYFAAAALDQEMAAVYFILMIAPLGVVSLFISPSIFGYDAILAAASTVRPEILGKVLESLMNNTDKMKQSIAEELQKKIGPRKNKVALRELFKQLDTDGNGILSSRELQKGLAKLGVFYSRSKFHTLLYVINSEGGPMNYDQFISFVYPDNSNSNVASQNLNQASQICKFAEHVDTPPKSVFSNMQVKNEQNTNFGKRLPTIMSESAMKKPATIFSKKLERLVESYSRHIQVDNADAWNKIKRLQSELVENIEKFPLSNNQDLSVQDDSGHLSSRCVLEISENSSDFEIGPLSMESVRGSENGCSHSF